MNKQEKDNMPKNKDKPDENMGLNVTGHILIRDKDTGQTIVDKRA